MPAVSVVLPTYNRLTYLQEAVASVVAQSMPDWELIVVDDGSTDDTLPWLRTIGDPRLTVVPIDHTANRSRVRNAGIARARGHWIAFLDSDDRWHPEKLERQLALHAERPEWKWSYSGRALIGANGQALPEEQFKPWQPRAGWLLEKILIHEANIALPSVIVDRALLRDVGGFDETFPAAEDFELWLRLAERSPCGCIDESLVDVRKHRAAVRGSPAMLIGFSRMFESLAKRSADPAVRRLASTRSAYHAVDAAEQLSAEREWGRAAAALKTAFRLRPLAPFTYRAAGRLLGRRFGVRAPRR